MRKETYERLIRMLQGSLTDTENTEPEHAFQNFQYLQATIAIVLDDIRWQSKLEERRNEQCNHSGTTNHDGSGFNGSTLRVLGGPASNDP